MSTSKKKKFNRRDKRDNSQTNQVSHIPERKSVRRKALLKEGKGFSTNRILTCLSMVMCDQMVLDSSNYPRIETKSTKISGKRVTVARGRTIARSTNYLSKWYVIEGSKLSTKKVPLWYGLANEVAIPQGVKNHKTQITQSAKKIRL